MNLWNCIQTSLKTERFIAGFFIKNPVAMPLFGITLLISFTMKQDSDKAFNHYTKECAKK